VIHPSFDPILQTQLLQKAREATKRAYAPFSKIRVGAALLTDKGNLFSGCNIENSSYGLTICAERTAIHSAVAEEGGDHMRIRALAVVNEQCTSFSPCGACRQVIFEFGPQAIVIYFGYEGLKIVQVNDILPDGLRLL
jgi:cytidine deaminase